jgi:aminopeptidase N
MFRKLSLLLLFSAAAFAQRLPDVAVPEHYSLKFTPDFQSWKFAGDETIKINVLKNTPTITLNQNDITFDEVTIESRGKTQTAKAQPDNTTEMVTLAVPAPLAAGPATVHIKYTGVLNDKLRGFYRAESEGHKYAVTQFEATEARRAFPSFDEPNYKAAFDITVVAPKNDMVISNGKPTSDIPGPTTDQHTVAFAPTPKMSTYLVAVLVGEFECLEGGADGIPIRVCTPPGKKEMGRFALTASEQVMSYYNKYFGIKYPYGKLDNVAIPDFEAGAMENTGAITYRDIYLLVDPKTASPSQEDTVASVIAHEMAHQWFGDLVTMKWWDDIWLNEGFATWMEFKPIEAWKPEWNVAEERVQSEIGALSSDSLQATRPIHKEVTTSAQIDELFDPIAYNKAAAVLNMVESYVGPEVFRQGVNDYLQAHAYGNATAVDFWTAITKASHKPADKIMSSFVMNTGVPLLKVNSSCNNGKEAAQLSQKRFFVDPNLFKQPANNEALWTIPVCLKAPGSAANQPECELLSSRQQTFTLTSCSSWLNANPGATGYYRVEYQPSAIQQLSQNAASQVKAPELMYLLDNQWAMARAGADSVGSFMQLAHGSASSNSHMVVDELGMDLDYLNKYLVSADARPAFETWVRNTFESKMQELGWASAATDDANRRQLRAGIFHLLGRYGNDPQAIDQAQKLTQSYLQDPRSVDPTMVRPALQIAAMHGGPQLYDQFLAKAKQWADKDPQIYYSYFFTLGEFGDPALLKRTLEMSLSPEVRSQNAPLLIYSVMRNPAGSELAWHFIQSHWNDLVSKFSLRGASRLVGATSMLCDPQSRQQVQTFFSEHKVPAAERMLRQATERIGDCVDFKQAQQPQLADWLHQQINHKTVAASGQ